MHRLADDRERPLPTRVAALSLAPIPINIYDDKEPDTASEVEMIVAAFEKRQDKKMTQDQMCDLINDMDISAETMVMATDLVQSGFDALFEDPEGDPKVPVRAFLPMFRKAQLGMIDDA